MPEPLPHDSWWNSSLVELLCFWALYLIPFISHHNAVKSVLPPRKLTYRQTKWEAWDSGLDAFPAAPYAVTMAVSVVNSSCCLAFAVIPSCSSLHPCNGKGNRKALQPTKVHTECRVNAKEHLTSGWLGGGCWRAPGQWLWPRWWMECN